MFSLKLLSLLPELPLQLFLLPQEQLLLLEQRQRLRRQHRRRQRGRVLTDRRQPGFVVVRFRGGVLPQVDDLRVVDLRSLERLNGVLDDSVGPSLSARLRLRWAAPLVLRLQVLVGLLLRRRFFGRIGRFRRRRAQEVLLQLRDHRP